MNVTITIDYSIHFDDVPDARVTVDLTDRQIAALVTDGAIRLDRERNDDTYWFDTDRIGEDWDPDGFGAEEITDLANLLVKLPVQHDTYTDAEALDLIALCLSAPEWSSSFLEDIAGIVDRTSHSRVTGAYWDKH